jgi:hypothetical protein
LDLVINNINDEAFIYRNNSEDTSNYLTIRLIGDSLNRNGLGAWIELYYDGKQQVYEQTPYRGYLSTNQIDPHFGLGRTSRIDSMIVKWPDGKKQVFSNVEVNQRMTVSHDNARNPIAGTDMQKPIRHCFGQSKTREGSTISIHRQIL